MTTRTEYPQTAATFRRRAGRFHDKADQCLTCAASSRGWLFAIMAQPGTSPEFVRDNAANVAHFAMRAARLRHAADRLAGAGRQVAQAEVAL